MTGAETLGLPVWPMCTADRGHWDIAAVPEVRKVRVTEVRVMSLVKNV